MSVRRRPLGPLLGFLAALVVVDTAHAQPGGRPVAAEDVKNAIERLLNRGAPAPDGPAVTPEQFAEFKQFLQQNPDLAARLLKNNPRPPGRLTPQQQEELKALAEKNPGLRKPLEGADPPAGPPPPGKFNPPPFNPGGKTGPKAGPPSTFKLDPPVERPPPGNDPPPPAPPRPEARGRPLDPPPPERVLLRPPVAQPPGREPRPWEEPESPQEKAKQAVASIWEKSVGPLKETPAVEAALFDFMDGTGGLKDADGNNFWDTFSKEFGGGKGLGDLLNGVDPGDGWKMPEWDFPKLDWNFNWGNSPPPKIDLGGDGPPRGNWFSNCFRRPASSASGGGSAGPSWFSGWQAPKWNLGIPALDGTWLPVIFLIAALAAGVFLWRRLAHRGRGGPKTDPYALGPWPVDPHHLATRRDVVVAFEHLSVLLCGTVAKTWTHTTIAAALSEIALAEPRRALLLARLYELARYTPADEPLSTAELAEARRIVCQLAGFGDE